MGDKIDIVNTTGVALDVIVVNWNSGELLRQCVQSIEDADINDHVLHLTVVDNGSTDDSAELPDFRFAVTVIKNEENLGFAAACNQALARTKAPFVLFLNPDARVRSNTIASCCKYLENEIENDVAVVGVRHYDGRGDVQPSCARFPSLATFVSEILGMQKVVPQLFKPMIMFDWDHAESRDVDHVMGAFMMVRRAILRQVGAFDEGFFMYLEDIDLSLRIRLAGYRIRFLADICVEHIGGGVSVNVKPQRLAYASYSAIVYAFKHFGRLQGGIFCAILFVVGPFTRILWAALHCSFTGMKDVLYGYALLIRKILTGHFE